MLILISLVKIIVVLGVLLGLVPILTWVERRGSALIQDRLGPNRVGPFGLFQPLADGIKFFFKEDLIPAQANKVFFVLAPVISLFPALVTFAVIPFGPPTTFFGLLAEPVKLQIADLDVGILYIFAIASLGVYGLVLAGWSSNSKYSLLGGLRASAQMISYEVAMALSVVGVLMMAGSLKLSEVVAIQERYWLVGPQIIGFIVFLAASFAETNRLPFDLPEAESEIVAGYHTEYSSMKFALFFMAEYANMVVASALIVTLFFGGWQGLPLGGWLSLPMEGYWFLPVVWFAVKVSFFLFLFIWVRWTLPRFRYDQLMGLGWKVFFPLSLINILITGVLIVGGVL
jgi:NADH-quinone oxidoreductase subunit H